MEGFFCELYAMLGLMASGGEEFNPGSEMMFDYLESLYNKVFIKV